MEKQVCKSTCFFVCTGSFVQGSGAWGAGRRSRFVYAARGRTFRRPCRRNSPASRFPAAMNLHGPAHEAPIYTWAHAAQNSRISVGKQCSNEMLGYGEKRLCAAHAFCPEYETRWERGLHRYEGGEAPLPGCRSMKQKHLGAGQTPVS